MIEQLKKAFDLFVSHDEHRPMLLKPAKQGSHYFASNGHILLMTSTDVADLGYEVTDKPDFIKVVPTETPLSILIDVATLKSKLYAAVPMVPKQVECPSCQGNGGEECNLFHWHDCERCEGSCEIDDPHGEMELSLYELVVIDGIGYSAYYLDRLITTAELLGVTTIERTAGSPNKASLYNVGVAKVVIMPRLIQGNDFHTIQL